MAGLRCCLVFVRPEAILLASHGLERSTFGSSGPLQLLYGILQAPRLIKDIHELFEYNMNLASAADRPWDQSNPEVMMTS